MVNIRESTCQLTNPAPNLRLLLLGTSSRMKKAFCRFCNESEGERIALLDGSTLHQACCNELQRQLLDIGSYVTSIDHELSGARKKLTFTSQLKLKFFQFVQPQRQILREGDPADLRKKIEILERDREIAKEKERIFLNLLTQAHEVWPTYPPDWSTRRASAWTAGGGACSECGDRGALDVHHLRPIREGGTHRLENLVLLCRDCHQEAHGGCDLGLAQVGVEDHKTTAIEKRIRKIRSAIDRGQSIHFKYTTGDGQETKRTVRPHDIRKLNAEEIERLTGKQVDREGALCMFGYCQLRKDDRCFAVSRMRGVKLVA